MSGRNPYDPLCIDDASASAFGFSHMDVLIHSSGMDAAHALSYASGKGCGIITFEQGTGPVTKASHPERKSEESANFEKK